MRTRSWARLATGVLIVLIGAMLLLVTTETVEADILWAWIPALFVLLGVWSLVRSGFQNIVGPVMVIAIAGAFLLRTLGVIEAGVIGTYWPLFVVLFGVLVIINRSRRRRHFTVAGIEGSPSSIIAVFSTDRRRISSDQFTDAEALAIFGDASVDLRDAEIPVPPARIEATAIFGDIEVIVPEDWEIDRRVMAIFGDVVDRRPRVSESTGDGPHLVLTGTAIFGDIEIRD